MNAVNGKDESGGNGTSQHVSRVFHALKSFVDSGAAAGIETLPCYFHTCSATEVATLLSHILAVRKAWFAGHQMALVAEDDVDLSLYDEAALRSIILDDPSLHKDWSSIQLYMGNPDVVDLLMNKEPGVMRLPVHVTGLVDYENPLLLCGGTLSLCTVARNGRVTECFWV